MWLLLAFECKFELQHNCNSWCHWEQVKWHNYCRNIIGYQQHYQHSVQFWRVLQLKRAEAGKQPLSPSTYFSQPTTTTASWTHIVNGLSMAFYFVSRNFYILTILKILLLLHTIHNYCRPGSSSLVIIITTIYTFLSSDEVVTSDFRSGVRYQ